MCNVVWLYTLNPQQVIDKFHCRQIYLQLTSKQILTNSVETLKCYSRFTCVYLSILQRQKFEIQLPKRTI